MDSAKDFWKGLSDFWTSFENRDVIENFWEGMLEAFKESSNNLHRIYLTPYQNFSVPVWDEKFQSFECIPSGVYTNNIQGTDEYTLPSEMLGTFSMPTLRGMETDEVLTEGVDYEILEGVRIRFLTTPTVGAESDRVTLVADTSKKIDGTIFNLYRKITDLELVCVNQTQYHPFTFNGDQPGTLTLAYKEEKALLIKYMSWGILQLRRQLPTIKNMKWLNNVLFNLPFSYEAGTAQIVGGVLTIGNFTYYNTLGSWGVSDGDPIERFQPLTDNVNIYDRVNNEALIESNFHALQKSSATIIDVDLLGRSSYLTTIINDNTNNHMSKSLNVIYNIH